MSIHEILNILVLTLSLATVLITLLTYLLHKIRQLPKSDEKSRTIKIDGLFFKRYLVGTSIEPARNPENSKTNSRRFLRTSYQAFFAILCAVIFFSIFFERSISQWKRSASAIKNADKYRDHVAKGLLKEYDFNPGRENPELAEVITDSQKENLERVQELLKHKRISLVQTSRNTTFNREKTLEAVKVWKSFLDFSGIRYREISDIALAGATDLLILPEAKSLSQSERNDLLNLARRGVGIIATGPVGVMDGTGVPASIPWGTQVWRLSYIKNIDPGSHFPTLFSGGVRAPWWEVPPGLLLNWFPIENSYQYTSPPHSEMAVEANYQGRTRKQDSGSAFVRAVFGNEEKLRLTWLALDPPDLKSLNATDQHYVRSAVLESLLWTAGEPIAKIGVWKLGFPAALVVSVDSEDQFSNALSLMKIFKKEKVPATFFTVSNLLKADPLLAEEADEGYEIASHTDDHGAMQGKSLTYQFEHIQNSRLAIEYLAGKKTSGFRPPEEGFDGTTLNAIFQNRMNYIFGDQHFHRFAPVSIANGGLVYFPRSALDDFNLVSKNGVFTDEQAVQALYADHVRVGESGGAHILNFHTQIYGKPENQEIVRKFLNMVSTEKIWKTNFTEMQKWWKDRQNVEVAIQKKSSDKVTVKVLNKNNSVVKDVALQIDWPCETLTLVDAGTQGMLQPSEDGVSRWIIPTLNPDQELILNFETTSSLRTPASGAKK